MKYKRFLFVLTVIAVLSIHSNAGYAQPIFAKLGTTFSADHPVQESFENFRDSLGEQLTLQIFPDAQLGSAQHLLEGLQFGHIEMGVLPLESLSRLDILGLPYLFKNDSQQAQVLDGPLGKRFLRTLNDLNLVGLGFLDSSPRFYLTKEQSLNTPEAFQNLKITLVCPLSEDECHSQQHERILHVFELMGAHPVMLSCTTLQQSLELERPDIVEYLPFIGMETVFKNSGFNTFVPIAHRTPPSILVAGKLWFESLAPETQEDIFRASNMLVRQQKEIMQDALRHSHEILREQGMNIAQNENGNVFEAGQTLYGKHAQDFGSEFEQFWQAMQNIKREE